jgi:hypothetical protein
MRAVRIRSSEINMERRKKNRKFIMKRDHEVGGNETVSVV